MNLRKYCDENIFMKIYEIRIMKNTKFKISNEKLNKKMGFQCDTESLGTLAVRLRKLKKDTLLFKIKKVKKENDEQIQKG